MPETEKYEWGTPEKVWMVTETLQKVELARALDRARVDSLANGSRPYSEQETKEFQHQLNVNWLEMTRKVMDATGQINNAFIPNGNFFTVHSEGGAPDKKAKYGQVFTKQINKILKKKKSGKKHHFLLRSRNASVALHGIGPFLWSNHTSLLPRFVPLEDLLIPTDTYLDFNTNLDYFAVNLYLTPGELHRMALTETTDKGWNKAAVTRIVGDLLQNIGQLTNNQGMMDLWERPEAIAELVKQNSGYLESDSIPKAKLRAFYYQEPKNQKWYRKIILRENTAHQPARGDKSEFIYESDEAFGEDVDHILQCQFGDCSIVPPLKYHSVRGYGTMLYAPCFTLNRLRSQSVQHVFSNLQTWWRLTDPNDRDRAKEILLMQHGILPEGASVIPQQERHQIDARLLEYGMSQLKQNIGENATSFTPAADTGTKKERTKFEVQAQLQASSAMVGNVLSMMYAQEIFYYEELVRRALIKVECDPAAKKFQDACRRGGIPADLLHDVDNWTIIPERVLGAGDGVLGQAQADALMSQKQQYPPDSQNKILQLWTAQTLDDPDRAADLVPNAPDESTSGTRTAEDVFATLMLGIAVPMRKGIDHVGYCAALLAMMQAKILQIQQGDNMGTPEDIAGFQKVATSIQENLQFLAQDDRNKPVVKQLNDSLGQLMNEVKGFAQRQQEAAQNAQPQTDPVAMAKIQTDAMAAQQKMQISEATSNQKLEQKQAAWEQKMAQSQQQFELKMAQQMAQLEAARAKLDADLQAHGMRTAAELQAKGMETAADIAAKEAQTKAAAKKPEKPKKES